MTSSVVDSKILEVALQLYKDVGALLKDDSKVLEIKGKIERITAMWTSESFPFVLVSAPSGSGKTQLPFALQAAGLEAIHLAVAINYDTVGVQEVYRSMKGDSVNLCRAVDADIRNLQSRHNSCDLEVIISYSKLRVSTEPMHAVKWICMLLRIELDSYTVSKLRSHIGDGRNRKPPIVYPTIFLDEIINSKDYNYDARWTMHHVRYLRNLLRSVLLVTVLMGKDYSAAELLDCEDSSSVRGVPWCYLITELPKVTALTAPYLRVSEALDRIRALGQGRLESVARLLESCVHSSNCVFVQLVCQTVCELEDEVFERTPAELTDAICGLTREKLRKRKKASRKGQLCLQLNACNPRDNMRVNAAWRNSELLLIHHFARLAGGDRLLQLDDGVLYYLDGKREVENWFVAKFAPVSKDPLLYLVCGGGVDREGNARRPFLDFGERDHPTRSTLEKECIPNINIHNCNVPFRNTAMMELIASVSLGTASRLHGLGGSTLDAFLPLLCAEVLDDFDLPRNYKLTWRAGCSLGDVGATEFGELRIPFIGCVSSPWPAEVASVEGSCVADMKRVAHQDRVKLTVRGARGSSVEVGGFVAEYNHREDELDVQTLRAVLRRVPADSRLHFVFCHSVGDSYFESRDTWRSFVAAECGDISTNVALVRIERESGKMWLEALSASMSWVSWETCERLVVVVALEMLYDGSGTRKKNLDEHKKKRKRT